MKRNWKKIRKFKDGAIAYEIAYAKDPEILAKYAKDFPELFMEGEDDGPYEDFVFNTACMDEVPFFIREQLKGKKGVVGMTVMYRGRPHMVTRFVGRQSNVEEIPEVVEKIVLVDLRFDPDA